MTLHQDKDERDFTQPIVSVSLGAPATFLFGGLKRRDRPLRLLLEHGDVVVWGGPSRLRYHGVAPLAESHHPFAGAARINLTLRPLRRSRARFGVRRARSTGPPIGILMSVRRWTAQLARYE